MNPSRRSLLFMLGSGAAVLALPGCSWENPCAAEYPDGSMLVGCDTSDANTDIQAEAGLDQYEVLNALYGDNPPATELDFKILRGDKFVYPEEDEFDKSDPDVWRYYFREGDIVAFAPIANVI